MRFLYMSDLFHHIEMLQMELSLDLVWGLSNAVKISTSNEESGLSQAISFGDRQCLHINPVKLDGTKGCLL